MKLTKQQIKEIIQEELQKETEYMAMHQHDANSTKAMQDKAVSIIMAMNVRELSELLKSDTMNSVFQRVMGAGQY